jgi:peroxiredoxin (alkyl hydroperoxide reductase subunit C)
MSQKSLLNVDWSLIPAPIDDGAADHLVGMTVPPLSLRATDDTLVTLSDLPGRMSCLPIRAPASPARCPWSRIGT